MNTIFQEKGISIDRLITLSKIQESGGIAEAARHDPRKQSLFSRQISELEETLGMRLLDRAVSPHQLTADAEVIEQITRTYIKELESYLASKTGENETITIAAGESIILWILIPILSKMEHEQQSRIRFRNMRSKQASDALAKGIVDIAIHNSTHTHKAISGIKSRALAQYSLCLVHKKGMIQKSVKKWSDLQNTELSIATLEGNGTNRQFINQLTSLNPKAPQIGFLCTSYPQILETCQSGKYIGIVPEIANPQVFKKNTTTKGISFSSIAELSKQKTTISLSYPEKKLSSSKLLKIILQKITP